MFTIIKISPLSLFLEILIPAIILTRKVERRKHLVLRLLAYAITTALLQIFVPWKYLDITLRTVAILLYLLASMFFFFKVNLFEAIFHTVSAFTVQHLAWQTWSFFYSVFDLTAEPTTSIVAISLHVAVYVAAFFILPARESVDGKGKYRVIMLVLSALIFFVCQTMNVIMVAEGFWNPYARVLSIICCVFILTIQYVFLLNYKLRSENEQLALDKLVLEELIQNEDKQRILTANTIETLELKYHDLKHQISALRLMTKEEQEEPLKQIEQAMSVYAGIAKTDNKVLNVVLTEKFLYCERNKIKFSYIIDGDGISFMDAVDISSLFGNAIDNAIDCVIKEQEEGKRIIKLNVSQKGNFLGIHVENYCGIPVQFENGIPKTNKDDNVNHGFGVKSIMYVVEKYNGTAKFDFYDNIFDLSILIPISATGGVLINILNRITAFLRKRGSFMPKSAPKTEKVGFFTG